MMLALFMVVVLGTQQYCEDAGCNSVPYVVGLVFLCQVSNKHAAQTNPINLLLNLTL